MVTVLLTFYDPANPTITTQLYGGIYVYEWFRGNSSSEAQDILTQYWVGFWYYFVAFALATVLVGVPAYFVRTIQSSTSHAEQVEKTEFLCGRFKSSAMFWQIVILARQACVGALVILNVAEDSEWHTYNLHIKFSLGFVVTFAYTVLQSVYRPWRCFCEQCDRHPAKLVHRSKYIRVFFAHNLFNNAELLFSSCVCLSFVWGFVWVVAFGDGQGCDEGPPSFSKTVFVYLWFGLFALAMCASFFFAASLLFVYKLVETTSHDATRISSHDHELETPFISNIN